MDFMRLFRICTEFSSEASSGLASSVVPRKGGRVNLNDDETSARIETTMQGGGEALTSQPP